MKALLNNKLAPVTFSIGFFQCSVEEAFKAYKNWRNELFANVETLRLEPSTLKQHLLSLQPFQVPPRTELLLETRGEWTAYFNNDTTGTDPAGISYIAQALGCHSVYSCCEPSFPPSKKRKHGVWGSVQFAMYGPEQVREYDNCIRALAAHNEGGRWEFRETGVMQEFEEPEKYRSETRIKNRFTDEMLERYCKALGIDLFSESFYGPEAYLIRIKDKLVFEPELLSLAELQKKLPMKELRSQLT